jgi:hypothetical protein
MARAVVVAVMVICADLAFAQPIDLHPNQPRPATPANPAPCSRDAMYCEIKQLVEDQGNCFVREARSKRIAKVDLETAAYAVVSSCIGPTQRLSAMARTLISLLKNSDPNCAETSARILQMIGAQARTDPSQRMPVSGAKSDWRVQHRTIEANYGG